MPAPIELHRIFVKSLNFIAFKNEATSHHDFFSTLSFTMSSIKPIKGLTLEVRNFAQSELNRLHEARQSCLMAGPRTEMADLDNEDYVKAKAAIETKFGEKIAAIFTPFKARQLVKHGPAKPLTGGVSARINVTDIERISQNVAKSEAVTRRNEEDARKLLEVQEQADKIKMRVSDFIRISKEASMLLDNNETIDINTPAVREAEDLMTRMTNLLAEVDEVSQSKEVCLQRVQLVEHMHLLANRCSVYSFAEDFLKNHKSFHKKMLVAPPIAIEKKTKRTAASVDAPATLSRLAINNMNQDVKRALSKNSQRMKGIVKKLDTIRESRERESKKKKYETSTVGEEAKGNTLEEASNAIELKISALCEDLKKYKTLLIASENPIVMQSSFFGFVLAPGVSDVKFLVEGPLKETKEVKYLSNMIDALLNDGTKEPAVKRATIKKKENYTVNKVALSSISAFPHIRELRLEEEEEGEEQQEEEEEDSEYEPIETSDDDMNSITSSVASEPFCTCSFCELEWAWENDAPATPWSGCETCEKWFCFQCYQHFLAHEATCLEANEQLI